MSKLLSSYPELVKEFHPIKNGESSPENYSYGSNKVVWWTCSNGHDWKGSIKERTQIRSPKKCYKCRSLPFNFPEIFKEFDEFKNADIDPYKITKATSKKVWWLCSKCNHSYQAKVNNRTSSDSSCPACTGTIVTDNNRLSVHFPKLCEEWNLKKNKKLTADDVSYGVDKKVWWLCKKCNYEFLQAVNKRTILGRGCPSCGGKVVTENNRFSKLYPELLKEIHPSKNQGFNPNEISYGSSQIIWWLCDFGHEWPAPIKRRTGGSGCPQCHPQSSRLELRIYSELKVIFKEVKNRVKVGGKEIDIFLEKLQIGIELDGWYWHQDKELKDRDKNNTLINHGISLIRLREKPLKKISKNDLLYETYDDPKLIINSLLDIVSIFAQEKEMHRTINEYKNKELFINEKEYLRLVSFLPGPAPDESFRALFPELAEEWNFESNFPLKPEMFHPFSFFRVSWICSKNPSHIWPSTIANRSTGHGCPYCDGKKTNLEESFVANSPELMDEFDTNKNTNLNAAKIAVNSNKKAWWNCIICGHSWKASFGTRSKGHGCPKCGKIAAAKKMGKKVRCIELNKTFYSLSEAERVMRHEGYKVSKTQINKVCSGKRKLCGGLTWEYIYEE